MRWLLGTLVGLGLIALPFVVNNYGLKLGTFMMMYAVLGLSWNFIGGFGGYPSFAGAAFFGLGAYVSAISQVRGLPMIASWVLAAFLAAVFAGGLGLALLRLRGHYFAIATLVVGEVLRELVNAATGLTGGGMGVNLPILRLGVRTEGQLFYFAMFSLATITLVVAVVTNRNRLGFGLQCIKQNEDAGTLLGINTTLYKTAAFVLSAVFVGCAGGIYASLVNYIEPGDVFDILLSVKPMVMVLFGGLGTIMGPILGAFVFLLLEEVVWRHFLTIHAGLLGLIIVALIFFLPRGLLAFDLRGLFRRYAS